FHRDLVLGVALILGRVLACVGRRMRRLRIGLGLGLSGLRFLHANVLVIALEVVALFLRDAVIRFGTRDARVVTRLLGVLVSGLVVRLGNLLLRLSLLDAYVLLVTVHRFARIALGFVLIFDLLVLRVVCVARDRRSGRCTRECDARGEQKR